MSKLSFSVWLLICAATVGAARADSPRRSTPPNIILILSDDVGIGDVHCYGGPYNTPHIDALAAGGMRFEYSYATPLCGPSRCQVLTGRYPFRTGLINNNRWHPTAARKKSFPDHEIMIPTMMKTAGYTSASIGKWGQMKLDPGQWGFDECLTYPGSGRYWREQTKYYTLNGKEQDLPSGKYLPDIMHRFLVDFIARHKDKPFFVYYPMTHIHDPILPTPDSGQETDRRRLYAANIEYMDKLVGQLIAELDHLHLREKTLVLFSGDNGSAGTAKVNGRAINGYKGHLLEGGSRVPLIANWPGVTPAGTVNHDLTDFSDFFATFAELGGAKLPTGVTLDSHSFAARLKGQKGSPRRWVYVELDGKSYVRDARFKLTNGGELFDLSDAPFQEIPLTGDTTETIAARARLQAVLDQHPAAPGDETRGKKAAAKE